MEINLLSMWRNPGHAFLGYALGRLEFYREKLVSNCYFYMYKQDLISMWNARWWIGKFPMLHFALHIDENSCRISILTNWHTFFSFPIFGWVFYHILLLLSGSQLQICPSGLTCCTEQMEQKLWSVSKDQYGKRIQSETGSIQRLFNKRGKKFDGKHMSFWQMSRRRVSGQNCWPPYQSACYLSCYLCLGARKGEKIVDLIDDNRF